MSNDIEPIEIEFLINSTTVAGQAERVRQSLTGVDNSVENSRKKFNELTREQLAAKDATDGLSTAFQNLSQITAAYFTFQGAKSLLTDIINIRGEYQKTEIAFSTMLGSGEKAKEIIADMVELAAVTPFGFEEINNGAKQLLAYQVQAEDLSDTIERLGNISAGLSQPLSRLILVYGQVKAKGKLMGDDLRQFTEAGIPIIAELAKVMNTTDSEVSKLVSNGEIGFDKVNKVIQNLTNEGGMFFNLMREQSKTIPGQIANIQDAIEQMFNKMGEQSEGTINTALDGVSFLVENYESVLTVLGSLIATYGSYKVAIMTLNAVENVRNKTIATEIASLSIADKMKLGRAAVTERQAQALLREAQAELTATQAKYAALQVEASSLALRKEKLVAMGVEQAQILRTSRTQLATAQAELASIQATGTVRQIAKAQKAVEIAQNEVIRNQELSSIANKKAIAVSQAFVNNQTQLGNASRTIKIASQRVENATEVAGVATKNLSALAESRLTIAQTLRAAATQLAARAQALLNATMLSNPIVAIVAVLGGLIYAYMQLRDVTDAQTKAEEALNNQRKETQKLQEDLKQKTQDRINVIKNETATVLEQSLAFEDLKKQYPETLKNMDLDALKKADLTLLNKEFNKSIEAFSLDKQKQTIADSSKKIDQLKANLKTLQESFTKATNEQAINGLNREINKTNELLSIESKILDSNTADYNRKIELQKVANMTVSEQKKYWEDQTIVIKQQLDILRANSNEVKNTSTQVSGLLTVSTQTSNVFTMWQIPTLLSQLDIAQQKVNEIKGAVAGESLVKNKNYWEEQKKSASGKNDAMSGRAENPKVWDENIKLIREAEAQLKKYDYSQKSSTKTRAKDTKTALEEIAKAERELTKMRMIDNAKEIADINDKYDKLRKQATKEKLPKTAFDRIDKAEKTEIGLITYSQDTTKLIKQLEKEKELFKLYEEAKTLIGADEITKRYEDQLKDAQTFGERLQQEITQITNTPENDRTGAETERLNKLLEYQRQYEKEVQEIQDDRYLKAYESSLTLQERLGLIEKEYNQKRLEIGKITDEKLRNEKLKVLNQQQKDAVNAARNEDFQIRDSRTRIFETALGLSKKEFKIKLASLEEYLQASGDLLDADTKKGLENEIEKGKSLLKMNDLSRDEKVLLEEKAKLMAEIKNGQIKGTEEMEAQLAAIENINTSLDVITKDKMKLFAERAYQVSDGMMLFANAVRSGNEDLAKTIETIAEIANDIGNIVNSFSKGLIDGIVSLVVTVVKWIVSIFTNAKKNREEDRKLMEEVKRFQAEAYQAQLDYNREVRERWMYEARINDLYTDRVTNIREEIEAMRKQKDDVLNDMNTVFARLMGSETITDQYLKNKKFLGIKRKKKKMVTESAAIWELLGFTPEDIENGIELTDELFRKLEELNAQRPLTGDAKEAFEQLKKLKEEYGSIDAAMKQAEIDLKNALTGTTAQSLADSIKEGLASGKRSFADFADDIEGFLRNAILAGLETKLFAKQIQELQDALADMMDDGVLTQDEKKRFQDMYMKIVNDANKQMEMLNQAGIDMAGSNQQNSLKGAIKGITEEQADLLAGQFGGLRLAQLETNQILKSSAAYQMQACSEMILIQTKIEVNTRQSADRLKLIYEYMSGTTLATNSRNSLNANGF